MRAVHSTRSGYTTDKPVYAAAVMHDALEDDARDVANGSRNVPIHPAQVPLEGSTGNESEGDGGVSDPTGQGFGT